MFTNPPIKNPQNNIFTVAVLRSFVVHNRKFKSNVSVRSVLSASRVRYLRPETPVSHVWALSSLKSAGPHNSTASPGHTYVPKAGSPGYENVPRAARPGYSLVLRAACPRYENVPRAARPGYIFVHRAGSLQYKKVPGAGSVQYKKVP